MIFSWEETNSNCDFTTDYNFCITEPWAFGSNAIAFVREFNIDPFGIVLHIDLDFMLNVEKYENFFKYGQRAERYKDIATVYIMSTTFKHELLHVIGFAHFERDDDFESIMSEKLYETNVHRYLRNRNGEDRKSALADLYYMSLGYFKPSLPAIHPEQFANWRCHKRTKRWKPAPQPPKYDNDVDLHGRESWTFCPVMRETKWGLSCEELP